MGTLSSLFIDPDTVNGDNAAGDDTRFGTGEHRDDIPQKGSFAEFNDQSGGYDQYEDGRNVFSHEKWMDEYLDKLPANPDSENV